MTNDGMLNFGDIKKLLYSNTPLRDVVCSCELIFPAKSNTADYHDSMDSETFFAWVENRLIPTFKARYPGIKMHLVLDNAKYHKRKCADYIDLNKMKRANLVDLLSPQLLNIEELVFLRKNVETSILRENINISRGGVCQPTVPELRDALKSWISKFQPHRNKLHLQVILESGLGLGKVDVIFTPPYMPDSQPIEKV